jgi:hypothetical protein
MGCVRFMTCESHNLRFCNKKWKGKKERKLNTQLLLYPKSYFDYYNVSHKVFLQSSFLFYLLNLLLTLWHLSKLSCSFCVILELMVCVKVVRFNDHSVQCSQFWSTQVFVSS